MATRMQQRRGTALEWLTADPVLAAGEIGFETDTNSFKIGDGINNWSLLDYFDNTATLQGTIDNYIPLSEKAQPLGVATLDANGFVPASQLDIDVTSDINAAISQLIGSAPATLDTLQELAAALGDDPAFLTNLATDIADAETNANSYTDTAISGVNTTINNLDTDDIAEGTNKYFSDTLARGAVSAGDGLDYDSQTGVFSAGLGYGLELDSNGNIQVDGDVIATDLDVQNIIGDNTVDGTTGNTVTDRIASAVSDLVDSAPSTLDTLNELAAALNDDANFATTVTNSLAAKAPLASPSFTGTVDFSNATVQGIEIPQPLHPFSMIGQ